MLYYYVAIYMLLFSPKNVHAINEVEISHLV